MGDLLKFCDLKGFKKDKNGRDSTGDGIPFVCPYSKEFNIKLENLNKTITLLCTALALILTVFIFSVNMGISSIDKSITSYKNEINSKFEIILNQLNNQKEINQLQIQHAVSIEAAKIYPRDN